MIHKIENLIEMIEKDIKWHDSEANKSGDLMTKVAHIGSSTALKQVVNDLNRILS